VQRSAKVRTAESFSFKYGRVEIRAKLPRGDWLWPALWLLPRHNSYGDWPASGEIDLVESRGNVDYPAGGSNSFGTTLHFGPFWPEDPYYLAHKQYTLPTGDFADEFHIFGLFWSNGTLYSYIDKDSQKVLSLTFDESFWQRGGWNDKLIDNPWQGRGNSAPFDQQFFLIFEVAVGGTNGYFPDGMDGKPWNNGDPHAVNSFWNAVNNWYPSWKGDEAAMQIDWVRVYQ